MAKSNAVWGIDIGQCALKALRCTMDSDGETVIADKYDFIEYPKILSHAEAEPEELVREALEQFLSRNNVAGDRVAVCVSGQAGLSRFFKPPPVEVKTLPDIVKYEVKQQIPFPIEDVIWDWQQLGGTVVDGRAVDAEVGLFAMKREAVFRALRPFDDVDVEVDIVQLSPLSIFNVVCHDRIEDLPDPEDFDPENPPESTVVMSMGTDTTDLIVTNGLKLWLRNIPIGGNHFTKQLSRDMKLTQAKAEHLKRNARQSENPKAIFKAMRPVFNDLVNEVQRSLTFFESNEKAAEIGEIVLLGNAAKLPGLRQFLGKQLEIDIAKVSEFNKLKGGDVVTQPTFANNLLSYAPCYGLCIQGLKKGKLKTNLLPEEIVVERIIRAKKPWVLAAVGALALGLLLGYFFKTNAWWRANDAYTDSSGTAWSQAISKVDQTKKISDGFVSTDQKMTATLAKLSTIADELTAASEGKATWIEFYSALTQAFPRDERIQQGKAGGAAIQIDPTVVDFVDRKELYVDHVESVYYEDLQEWYSGVGPIHRRMFMISDDELEAAKAAGADTSEAEALEEEEVDEEAAEVFSEVPGWVIEIQGHHFHNSKEKITELDAGKSYLVGTLIKNLMSKVPNVKLPFSDEEFTYQDIGISYPTVTVESEIETKTIVFDPTASGAGDFADDVRGRPKKKTTLKNEDVKNVFVAQEYKFVVQMAWTPRRDTEILAARDARVAAEQEAAEAAGEQGGDASDQGNTRPSDLDKGEEPLEQE